LDPLNANPAQVTDLSDFDELRRRLDAQPEQLRIALAARAALRVLPMLGLALPRSGSVNDTLEAAILSTFRAVSTAWIAPFEWIDAERFEWIARSATASSLLVDTTTWINPAASAAQRSATESVRAVGLVGPTSTDALVTAIKEAFAAEAREVQCSGLSALADDFDLISKRGQQDRTFLSRVALWPTLTPHWVEPRLSALQRALHVKNSSSDWRVWILWYHNRLNGTVYSVEAETAYLNIPDGIWTQGPAAVNAEIIKRIGIPEPPPDRVQPDSTPTKPTIFISYTSRDRNWAHWIGVTLRDNGYTPFVHEWEVGAGENLARWMDESIEAADRMLGVFTDAYVKALFSSSERWAAYWDDPQGRKGFLVPVEVERVTRWPPLTRALKRLSLVGLSEAEAEHALLEFLKPPRAPSGRPIFPGGRPSSPDRPKSPDALLLSKAEPLPSTRPAWPSATKKENEDRPDEAPPDPSDHESFARWLGARPREWWLVIAARAALRTIPFTTMIGSSDAIGRFLLSVFRATSASRYASLYPIRPTSAVEAARALAAEGFIGASSSIVAAYYAASAVSSSDPSYSARALVTATEVVRQDAAILLDAFALYNGVAPSRLAQAPLWRPAEEGGTPRHLRTEWQKLANDIRHLGDHWRVWIDWYEYVLQGSPLAAKHNESREAVYVDSLPWEKGAEAVNTEIAARLERPEAETMWSMSYTITTPDQSLAKSLPVPIEGVFSAVDFTAARGRPIRAQQAAEVQPVLKTSVDKRDHKPRLDLCRDSALTLLETINQHRFNVREGYRQALSENVRHLPTNTRKRNILFADQETRILHDLFVADADSLSPEFAIRLKALLQAHQALRVFYPGLMRFYDDVRFGRTSEPLPIDAAERIANIVEEAPHIFDSSVVQALSDAAPPLPAPTEPRAETGRTDLQPPPDPMGSLPTEKAQAYARAGIINRLWAVFGQGEKINKNAESWVRTGQTLAPHIVKILDWLNRFWPGGGDGTPPMPPPIVT
jgi:hypothetical protein